MPDSKVAYTIAIRLLPPDTEFRSRFFDCAVKIALEMERLLGDDAELAGLVHNVRGSICAADVEELAEWVVHEEQGFLIFTSTWVGTAFALLAGCGLFRPTAQPGVYEVGRLRSGPSRVRHSLMKLFGTLDAAGELHPEQVLSCMSAACSSRK